LRYESGVSASPSSSSRSQETLSRSGQVFQDLAGFCIPYQSANRNPNDPILAFASVLVLAPAVSARFSMVVLLKMEFE